MTLFCFCGFDLSNFFGWRDFWALIGAGLGAYIGFFFASQIYKRERKDKKVEEEEAERQLFESARLLIERAAEGGRDAQKRFEELLDKYSVSRYGLHKRALGVNTPLITLDRMDRVRLLRSYKFVLGDKNGVERWRETWHFCDGLAANTKFSDNGVLSGQKDLHESAKRFGGYCQELIIIGSGIVAHAETEDPVMPAGIKELSDILRDTHQLGFIQVDAMHTKLVEPLAELFKKEKLTMVNAEQLGGTLARARLAFRRYGQIVDEIKANLKDYATGCGDMAGSGEDLLVRMKNDQI